MLQKLNKNFKKQGFTLIELIVVLAIISIMAAITAPNLVGYIDASNRRADEDATKSLNQSTIAYYVTNQFENEDAFLGINSDTARQQVLVDEGFLPHIYVTQTKGASFNWDIKSQTWILKGINKSPK